MLGNPTEEEVLNSKKNIAHRNNHLELIFVFMDIQLLNFNEIDHKITVTLERLEKML